MQNFSSIEELVKAVIDHAPMFHNERTVDNREVTGLLQPCHTFAAYRTPRNSLLAPPKTRAQARAIESLFFDPRAAITNCLNARQCTGEL